MTADGSCGAVVAWCVVAKTRKGGFGRVIGNEGGLIILRD